MARADLSPDLPRALLRWFDQHGRHGLPWQKRPTPYRVWVSEIMLQQTQVATVIPYFERFMKRFPHVKSLAEASADEVLSYWSGLGYYARARCLHQTAQLVKDQYYGRFPRALDALVELPGIGRSTAGAILTFSMDIRAVILDGNVKRVLTRYYALEEPINKPATLNILWDLATQNTPIKKFKEYNQGIMDIGALICTRTKPKCLLCPLQKECQGYSSGYPERFPISIKSLAKRPQKTTYMLLMVNDDGEILLEKRPPTGIWGGLWSFPECKNLEEIPEYIRVKWDFKHYKKILWKPLPHVFTHFFLMIHPVLIHLSEKQSDVMDADSQVWYSKNASLPGGIPKPVSYLLKKLTTEMNDD